MTRFFTGVDPDTLTGSANPSTEVKYNPDPLQIRQEKDFIVKSIILVAYDGSEYDINWIREELVIRESVFENFMTGYLVLDDSVDLPQLYPIIGEEKLKVVFTRPAVSDEEDQLPDYTGVFRIYKMTNQQLDADRKQHYVLHFASEEYIKTLKYRVQRAFEGLKYSTMVEKIFNKYLAGRKPLEVEVTKGEHKFVIPNYYPVEFFNAVSVMSISAANKGANYFFFEDKDQFNFKSLGELFGGGVKETYLYQPANVLLDQNRILKDRDIEKDIVSAEGYNLSSTFDILANLIQGMYASRLVTIDSVRKIYNVYDFDYKEKFDSFPHIEKHDVCSDDLDALNGPQSSVRVVTTNLDQDKVSWIASREPGILPNKIEKWLQKRMTQLLQIQNMKISVVVSGDPRRKCGEIVEFKIPSQVGDVRKDKPQEENKYLTGKYFVSTVIHQLVRDSYKLHLELIKDTYFNKIEHVDPTDLLDPIW